MHICLQSVGIMAQRRERREEIILNTSGLNILREKRVEERTRQGEQNVTYIQKSSLSRPIVIALITPSIVALVLTIIMYGVGFGYYSRLAKDLSAVKEHNSGLVKNLSTLQEQCKFG